MLAAIVRDAVLIVNPYASAVTEARVRGVEQSLSRAVRLRTVLTERPGDATELARAACEEADVLFVFGGDGAVNEALNGLDAALPIGLIPGGGSSVLARALGLPSDPEEAARQVMQALRAARTRVISLGRVNGRRFGFAAALGFPAEVVRRVDERGRARRGRRPPDRAFLTSAARILAERRGRLPSEIEVRGHGRTSFALVANGDPYTYLWRLPVRPAPGAMWEDGLDVVAPRTVGPLAIPRFVAAALTGREARGVLYLHDVDAIELRADRPLPLQVDGEDLGDVERATFSSERKAAKILL